MLAIAIDRYAHALPLANCVRDAGDVVRILTTSFDVEPERVRTLYDADASRAAIIDALDAYATAGGPWCLGERDSLIIYFAGHGESHHGMGAWIPVDAADQAGRLLVSTVRDYLEPIRARHIFVVVDSCFSGRFFGSTRGPLPSGPAPAEDIPSRYALTAGRDQRVLDGAACGNSPFADAFKFQLATAEDSIGAVALSERVLAAVAGGTEQFQTPRHGELHIDGNRSGQFYLHRRNTRPAQRDAFVEEYVARGGQLIPPEHRTGLLQHYDQYDASYRALSPELQVAVRRNNTLAYLAQWGLDIAALSGALARLGYLTAAPPDEYCEEIAEALRRFQADQMMRQIDGFFGDLTYRQMVGVLLERGLATAPARTPR